MHIKFTFHLKKMYGICDLKTYTVDKKTEFTNIYSTVESSLSLASESVACNGM